MLPKHSWSLLKVAYSFRVFVSTPWSASVVTTCRFLRVILLLSIVLLCKRFLRNCVLSDITKILTKGSQIIFNIYIEVGIVTISCAAISASVLDQCNSLLLTSYKKLCSRPSWTKSWPACAVEASYWHHVKVYDRGTWGIGEFIYCIQASSKFWPSTIKTLWVWILIWSSGVLKHQHVQN